VKVVGPHRIDKMQTVAVDISVTWCVCQFFSATRLRPAKTSDIIIRAHIIVYENLRGVRTPEFYHTQYITHRQLST